MDIGGSGIKGCTVDLDRGELAADRLCAAQVDALLSPAERADFLAGVAAARAALD